ncbi:hypothetical protein S96127_1364 [Yersinia pestis]|nr:hypothetical protein S96127_1364 [Yersinia pestis]
MPRTISNTTSVSNPAQIEGSIKSSMSDSENKNMIQMMRALQQRRQNAAARLSALIHRKIG